MHSAKVDAYVLVSRQYINAADEQEIEEIGDTLDNLWRSMSDTEREETRGLVQQHGLAQSV